MEHYRYTPHDHATSNVLAWTTTNSANVEPSVEEDAGADADEPPDCPPVSPVFKRIPMRRGSEQHESLLTRAFQSHSEEEGHGMESLLRRRRRSIVSNFSFTSTAELTCDTGLTTPARTSSPSPRFSGTGFVPLSTRTVVTKTPVPAGGEKDAVQALQKKRCISFACAAKPTRTDDNVVMPPPPLPKAVVDAPKPEAAPKKTTIKFACPAQPPRVIDILPKFEARPMTPVATASRDQRARSPSTVRAPRGSSSRTLSSEKAIAKTKDWLSYNASDLSSQCAQFYEFASEGPQVDEWVRREDETEMPKLTIHDTLQKENAIRKLGKEAEEEADLEEGLDEEVNDEEDEEEDGEDDEEESPEDDDLDDEDDELDDDEADEDCADDDAETEFNWDDEASDGYKTDNEIGFAESDDEDDELVLWTTRVGHHTLSGVPLMRRPSIAEHSDSSACSQTRVYRKRRSRSRPFPIRPHTPELPDSTDFVCGTLDEDRPLEDAYISCVEARKRNKLLQIPQDIDPSFPTSEPEDEVEEAYARAYNESDEHAWLHGEFEDLHHERDRRGRKGPSPNRLRSPPPRRRASPAPKSRGRSPPKPSDRQSPRRMRSPAPACMAYKSSAATSLGEESEHVPFKALALRPGLIHTKSLPRAPGMFPHLKTRKAKAINTTRGTTHVRGAIDIVKGLEQKRQRRKEKFYQKYCSRARKEKAQPKRPPPGQGAERMRELGLTMAGKVGPGHYVLSI